MGLYRWCRGWRRHWHSTPVRGDCRISGRVGEHQRVTPAVGSFRPRATVAVGKAAQNGAGGIKQFKGIACVAEIAIELAGYRQPRSVMSLKHVAILNDQRVFAGEKHQHVPDRKIESNAGFCNAEEFHAEETDGLAADILQFNEFKVVRIGDPRLDSGVIVDFADGEIRRLRELGAGNKRPVDWPTPCRPVFCARNNTGDTVERGRKYVLGAGRDAASAGAGSVPSSV